MRRVFLFLSVMVLMCAGVVCRAESKTMSAVFAQSALSVSVPYEAARTGDAELKVEVLSPEDDVMGKAVQRTHVTEGAAVWNAQIALVGAMTLDEIVWERVRFTLRYVGEAEASEDETRSVSAILMRPVMRVLGQRTYIAGAQAAMRVIVSTPGHDEAPSEGRLRIELMDANQARLLYAGKLDKRGSAEAEFRFPEGLTGNFPVRFEAETPVGNVETTETVKLEEKVGVLLTSEKPIYQPSQTMHLRALALDRADHHAAAERKLTFEVEDPRGNKVFRKATETDKFGVAWAEFTLADEVNMGAYHVRAKLGDGDSNAAELNVNVERYVLPKFRVAIEFQMKDGKQKRDYRPGDHVTGTVKANYFFGKPVDHAAVTLKASAMDVELFEAATAEGHTDGEGVYHFDLMLPRFLAGNGAHHGAAPVVVEATVKDAADHAETRGEPITVSKTPLIITAVPEGGKLVRGMENEVYVLVSYADGTPAKAEIEVRGDRLQRVDGDATVEEAKTDDAGIAVVKVAGEVNPTLRIVADDRKGNRATETVQLETRDGEDQVLLRTSRAVYRPGDNMEITVLSTRQRGAAYIDLVHEGQTILTRDVDVENGRAELNLRVTPEMAGTLMVHAYGFAPNSREMADQRLVFVEPAEELRVEATADAASYLPGGEARVHFRVTNAKGEGVTAALGLEVVDQAVFALAEKQPGFAKVFFYLEQELLKPRYEIHSLTEDEIVKPADGESWEQHDRAARALFAAAKTVTPNSLNSEAGRGLPEKQMGEFHQRYEKALLEYVKGLTGKMKNVRAGRDVPEAFKALRDDEGRAPHDAWGTELRIEEAGWMDRNNRWYVVRSAGPDGVFNTGDDLTVGLQTRIAFAYSPGETWRPAPRGRAIDLKIEHDIGPDNGLAEIAGTVTDQTGAVVPGARIRVTREQERVSHEAVADAVGRFSLTALHPGRYTVHVLAQGFEMFVYTVTVAARDRAVLPAVLTVGSETQTVTVQADAMAVQTEAIETRNRNFAGMAPLPLAAARGQIAGFSAGEMAETGANPVGAAAAPSGHIRSYFPEALYINPEILTDGEGNASITIPLADSITTWRMAMFASTQSGALGSGTAELKVFQDFFVDLDLPVTLTEGDRITIPVAVYNYAGHRGDVKLTLEPDDWFALKGADEQTVTVDQGQVGAADFTIETKRIGKFRLTLTGRMSGESERDDTVVREIEVVPNGEAKEIVFNGRLDKMERQVVRFPAGAIPDASKIFVRLYPGPLSQVIEGMDGILQMPYGCFEQTSSSTYPNVLALDYMKRTKKLTPEVHAKAEGFIATGYQRLLTFEVQGGGFSWFGNAPANKILTAYGLMEFSDMARVYEVDPNLIARTRDWLVGQQQQDGSWKPDTQFINEGATNRFNTDVLRITAYIAWALETAEYKGDAVERARRYIAEHMDAKADAYTLAVVANFAVANDKDSEVAQRAIEMLSDAARREGELAWWTADETGVYGRGESAAVETTGLAVQAMLKVGGNSDLVRKALGWITARKNGAGNWGTTQATIMALRALLEASEMSDADSRGTVDVVLNGTRVASLDVNKENNDLLHQFVLPQVNEEGENEVELRFAGEGGMAYQVAGRYFVPWQTEARRELLAIDVKYDRTRLAQDEMVNATATIRNNTEKTAKMVMVDLGIPPGFELESEDLQTMVEKTAGARSGRLEKFSMTATQAILYFDSIAPGDSFEVQFRLRAKYPIHASGFASRVYEYYDPGVSATTKPAQFEVIAHR